MSADPTRPTSGSPTGPPTVDELVAGYGVAARPIRAVVAALTEHAWTLADLVATCGVPHRTVQEVLTALGADLRVDPGPPERVRIAPDRVADYRDRFGYQQLRRTAPVDPLGPALAEADALVETVRQLRLRAPTPRRALDHVAATPETAVRRALWLDRRFDLAGAHLLCVGDHDLTSLVACLVCPGLTATVVDVDERLLAYLDETATAHGLAVRCLAGDLRFGLPPAAVGTADLAFTDPPYTPAGVRLFLARAVEGLRDTPHGRILLAYGYSDRTPALGLEVQRAVADLHLATEAILPGFNRYLGAQALGGTSDLYTLHPTARARRAAGSVRLSQTLTIYTHGGQSAEGRASLLDPTAGAAVVEIAAGPERLPVYRVGPAATWPTAPASPTTSTTPTAPTGPMAHAGTPTPAGRPGRGNRRTPADRPLGTVLAAGVPAVARSGAVAADLTVDPGSWLPRVLLAVNARRLVVVVAGDHPDARTAATRQALATLVAAKWSIRFRRNTPSPGYLLIEAVPADNDGVVRHILDRAHGKLGNVWRDALVHRVGLTRREAAARVAAALTAPWATGLDPAVSLLELPRHRMTPLLSAVEASTEPAEGAVPG